tara:strand:+ start:957 stop:1484 length:528 start_codon:yes stop_codon:yes gene_type:complete
LGKISESGGGIPLVIFTFVVIGSIPYGIQEGRKFVSDYIHVGERFERPWNNSDEREDFDIVVDVRAECYDTILKEHQSGSSCFSGSKTWNIRETGRYTDHSWRLLMKTSGGECYPVTFRKHLQMQPYVGQLINQSVWGVPTREFAGFTPNNPPVKGDGCWGGNSDPRLDPPWVWY